jgi:plastocyanin
MQPLVRTSTLVYTLLWAVCAGTHATELLIDQKDKQFSKKSVKIKVGDVVEFRNSDPFAHNIFSLSDAKSFDLGSYPQGQSKKVSFDKPGRVEVECSIHPGMQMVVEVEK